MTPGNLYQINEGPQEICTKSGSKQRVGVGGVICKTDGVVVSSSDPPSEIFSSLVVSSYDASQFIFKMCVLKRDLRRSIVMYPKTILVPASSLFLRLVS